MPRDEREALAERLREERAELDTAEGPPEIEPGDEGEPADEIEPIATPTDD